MSKRAILIVLDSVGIGALPDAAEFDDVGANTLGHIQERHPLNIPNMRKLGIGHIEGSPLPKWEGPVEGAFGKCMEVTHAKDTTCGHWEMAGSRRPSWMSSRRRSAGAPWATRWPAAPRSSSDWATST